MRISHSKINYHYLNSVFSECGILHSFIPWDIDKFGTKYSLIWASIMTLSFLNLIFFCFLPFLYSIARLTLSNVSLWYRERAHIKILPGSTKAIYFLIYLNLTFHGKKKKRKKPEVLHYMTPFLLVLVFYSLQLQNFSNKRVLLCISLSLYAALQL